MPRQEPAQQRLSSSRCCQRSEAETEPTQAGRTGQSQVQRAKHRASSAADSRAGYS